VAQVIFLFLSKAMTDIGLNETKFWARKFYRRAIQLIGSHFYVNPDPDLHRTILVAGTARSGTTWLSDLIASQIPSRILFEPFNPSLVPEYQRFQYFQYMRPGTENPEFYTFAQKVFTGEIRNRWIDRQNERIISKFRLVKEIRANLALKWLRDSFPGIPILFIIRHPCAVVLSRMELDWATDRDIEPFLSQPELIEDHLVPYVDLIRGATSSEEKHAVIWSVSNLVPLKQLTSNEWKVVYYESLCTNPEGELSGIFEALGHPLTRRPVQRLAQPSQTSRPANAVATGPARIGSWKSKLSGSQIQSVLRVVRAFGLDHLYGDSTLPLDKHD
jgi:sulfotransferase family protein